MSDTLPRDIRVDQIGYVDELQKHFANDLRSVVKVCMLDGERSRVAGDCFEGLLVDGYSVQTIDADKLLRLLERKKITRAQFLSAIKVTTKPATAFLSGDQIAAMSETTPGSPQLRVSRIKGVDVRLVDAVKRLVAAFEPA